MISCDSRISQIQFLEIYQQKQKLVLFPNSVSYRGKGNDGIGPPTAKGPTLIAKQMLLACGHD